MAIGSTEPTEGIDFLVSGEAREIKKIREEKEKKIT